MRKNRTSTQENGASSILRNAKLLFSSANRRLSISAILTLVCFQPRRLYLYKVSRRIAIYAATSQKPFTRSRQSLMRSNITATLRIHPADVPTLPQIRTHDALSRLVISKEKLVISRGTGPWRFGRQSQYHDLHVGVIAKVWLASSFRGIYGSTTSINWRTDAEVIIRRCAQVRSNIHGILSCFELRHSNVKSIIAVTQL